MAVAVDGYVMVSAGRSHSYHGVSDAWWYPWNTFREPKLVEWFFLPLLVMTTSLLWQPACSHPCCLVVPISCRVANPRCRNCPTLGSPQSATCHGGVHLRRARWGASKDSFYSAGLSLRSEVLDLDISAVVGLISGGFACWDSQELTARHT